MITARIPNDRTAEFELLFFGDFPEKEHETHITEGAFTTLVSIDTVSAEDETNIETFFEVFNPITFSKD